ncbi:hypothetical protein [Nocardioides caricicola]|uniref:VanZ family protein n=1 Tax=Nocardioides caricicola TaxID=634770 RepID=A0ABW0MX21_9ACTN
MTEAVATRGDAPGFARPLDILAKAGLVLLLWVAIAYPELGHLRGKGAMARAIGYPVVAFLLPLTWWLFWRGRAPFPWVADLLITSTCFSDVLGNRMDLYDTVRSFDDWMHLINPGLLTAAVLMISLPRSATLGATIERALAFGMTAAVAWELAEYVAFLRISGARLDAYADTLGDLALGGVGALISAVVVWQLSRTGRLVEPPLPRVDRAGHRLAA